MGKPQVKWLSLNPISLLFFFYLQLMQEKFNYYVNLRKAFLKHFMRAYFLLLSNTIEKKF